jgi:hypothetical protein
MFLLIIMNLSINFYDESMLHAEKIDDTTINGNLPSKFEVLEASTAQFFSQDSFRFSHILPQLPSFLCHCFALRCKHAKTIYSTIPSYFYKFPPFSFTPIVL